MADRRNYPALAAAAALFGTTCRLHRHDPPGGCLAPAPPLAAIRRDYDLILGLETVPGARNLFTYRLPRADKIALFVGNEQRGLSPAVLRLADGLLQIPMRPQGLQSLNVAGAAAVALSQLAAAGRGRLPPRRSRHPALVFVQPADPAELGSALRAAWTLGWDRAGLIDSHAVWFTRERAVYAQGRGAARRHKNPLAVYPCDPNPAEPPYERGVVVTLGGPGAPLWRTRLPLGPRTVLFLADECQPDPRAPPVPYTRLAREIQYVSLDLPAPQAAYDYRLVAAILLAEIARRCGWGL